MAIVGLAEANEQSSCVISFRLVDYHNPKSPPAEYTGIGLASITSATMTLTDSGGKTIINQREDVDVKQYFDANGYFRMVLDGADNPVLDKSAMTAFELHIATFKIAANNGTDDIDLTEEFQIKVTNKLLIPNG